MAEDGDGDLLDVSVDTSWTETAGKLEAVDSVADDATR